MSLHDLPERGRVSAFLTNGGGIITFRIALGAVAAVTLMLLQNFGTHISSQLDELGRAQSRMGMALSGCSTPSPPAIETPPAAAMIRPPCTPPDLLMRAPEKLAQLPAPLSEQAAVQAWLADMAAYQALRRESGALQSFIRQNCQ